MSLNALVGLGVGARVHTVIASCFGGTPGTLGNLREEIIPQRVV